MKNKKGFTLIELIIVISLLVVVAGLFTMSMMKSINKQKEEENKDIVAQIVSAANAYVSVNPQEVENLFNGYGYVDIPIGTLRDDGLLSEDLKDAKTGKRIPDDDKVRVKLDLGDYLDFIYPVDKSTDAWKFVAEDLYVDYSNEDVDWCSIDDNVYTGLITDPLNSDYEKFQSKMYLMNNKEGDPDEARMYTGDYFDEGKVNLRVTSCNVNPNKVGTYNITYKYFDEALKTEKTVNRVVYVNSSNEDVMGFTVVINRGQPIVRGTPEDEVPILIKEIYRNGAKDIPTTVGELASIGYEIKDFKTDTVGEGYTATVSRVVPNSDGSIPEPQKPNYDVISDTWKLTFDAGNGTVSPKDKIVTYKKPYGELPTPLRTGYDFAGWFTEAGGLGEEVTSETIMMTLKDHTLYAKWTPKEFTITFNPNTGVIDEPTKDVTYDDTYGELPTPTKPGYDFEGWYTAKDGGNKITDKTVVKILADQELYAHWTPKTYQVAFESNGCGSITNKTKNVSYDSTYGPLGTASKSDYIFNGWYTAKSGGTKVDQNTKVTGDQWLNSEEGKPAVTLYAHCTYNPPPVTPPYTPPSNRPTNNNNNSGGSSTNSSCTPSCGNACGNEIAAGQDCSNKWWQTTDPDEREALHIKAQEHYGNGTGGNNTYQDSDGTTWSNGVQISPKNKR